ncbi:MAG: hypothetical protein ABIR30_03135 [Chitinophagaceae bacterium]
MKFLQAISFAAICMSIHLHSGAQNCVLNCPANIVVKAENGKEGANVSFPAMSSPEGCGTLTYTPASGSFFRLGSHSIILTSSSGQKCSFSVTVADNEPPSLSPITLSRQMLWPASNKMKKVGVNYTTSDNALNVKTALSVTSNATDGVKDWEIVEDKLVRLKASRLPDGSPRIYMITVTATDEAGNKTSRTTSIAVSKTMVAKPQKP